MYSNGFYPDGLTEMNIDALIADAYASADEAAASPTSRLLDRTDGWRRARRIENRTVGAVVRALPVRPLLSSPNGQEAA